MSEPRSSAGEATRQSLISAAERLFAAQGVDGTSIAAITEAAGQRNNYAVGWHFGGKAELLEAVQRKHQDRIDRVRTIVLDAMAATGPPDTRAIAHALVAPLTERLTDPDGGADYLRIQAEQLSRRIPGSGLGSATTQRLLDEAARVVVVGDPDELADVQALIISTVFHGLADFAARRPDADDATRVRFERLLVDTVTDILDAHNRRVGAELAPS